MSSTAGISNIYTAERAIDPSLTRGASVAPRYRLAVVQTHVIEYYGPFFRELAKRPEIDLTVYYGSRLGSQAGYDPGFEINYQWDRPLLDGYEHRFLEKPTQLPGELRRGQHDAVLIYGWATRLYWLAYLTCLASGIPYLIAGDSVLRPQRSWWRSKMKAAVLPPLFRRAAALLTMGALNEQLYQSFGIGPEKCFLCPYSPDTDFFRERSAALRKDEKALRRRYGINADAPVVLFVGKLIPRKRPMDLLAAFGAVRRLGIKGSLVFCGAGPLRPALERYAEEHRLESVYFVGFQNQSRLPEIYALADVVALPSEEEPWGVVLNEAMACRLPVIVSDAVGAAGEPRFIKNAHNALVVPVGDVHRLGEALALLLRDATYRARLGHAAAATIDGWDYRLCVRGVLNALRHALG